MPYHFHHRFLAPSSVNARINNVGFLVTHCARVADALHKSVTTSYNEEPVDIDARVEGVSELLAMLLEFAACLLFDIEEEMSKDVPAPEPKGETA